MFRSHSPGYGGFRGPVDASRASLASAGFGAGGKGVRGLAPGFYLHCQPVGAAPRISVSMRAREREKERERERDRERERERERECQCECECV